MAYESLTKEAAVSSRQAQTGFLSVRTYGYHQQPADGGEFSTGHCPIFSHHKLTRRRIREIFMRTAYNTNQFNE